MKNYTLLILVIACLFIITSCKQRDIPVTDFEGSDFGNWKVGNTNHPIRITIEVDEQGEYAIRNLTVHNAPFTLSREFENGVVLVNTSYDAYDFNLEKIFPGIKSYKRLSVEKSESGISGDNLNEVSTYNNGERIKNAGRVIVPGLNALFLIKE